MIKVNMTEVELDGDPITLATEVTMAAFALRDSLNMRDPGFGDKIFNGIISSLQNPEIDEEMKKEVNKIGNEDDNSSH